MNIYSRRTFCRTMGLAAGAAALLSRQAGAAPPRKLKAGHTGITWGYRPEDAEYAVKDVASLGFAGFESFGNVLEAWEPKGGFGKILDSAGLPLISAYCGVNLTEPEKRKTEVEKIVRWGSLIKKYGGTVAVIGPNPVQRPAYRFAGSKANILAA